MKTGIKSFRKKHFGSIIILKILNDPLHVRKEIQSITLLWCYFHNNKGHDHILPVSEDKDYDGHKTVSK